MNEKQENGYEYWPLFDSFVKKVVKKAKYEFRRQMYKDKRYEPTDDFEKLLQCHAEDYPVEQNVLNADRITCDMEDERLFAAMQQLPKELLVIIILKFWYKKREDEIAENQKVTNRTCYTRRMKALKMLKQLMEGLSDEQIK